MSRFRKFSPEAPEISKPQWLTTREYAAQVNRAESTVRYWIMTGSLKDMGIPYYRSGKRWFIYFD